MAKKRKKNQRKQLRRKGWEALKDIIENTQVTGGNSLRLVGISFSFLYLSYRSTYIK